MIRFSISPQKRKGKKSIFKTDLMWNFWTSDYVTLKVSCASWIVFVGLSSLTQSSSLGKTDSSPLKHPLMPVALFSWKKPHENSPIHTWHVNCYSYVLDWFRKPYCWWFPGAYMIFLSYKEDTVYSRHSRSVLWLLAIFPRPLPRCPPSHRCRGHHLKDVLKCINRG